jgi:3-deoxy-D-manno-octulosonic-acid transferase
MLAYRILSIILFPFIEIYLFWRVYKKKEDRSRLKERFGQPTQNRPSGEVIWVHAVSVGETNSVLILVEELLKNLPQASILFTTTTLTSAATVAAKLPQFGGRVIHQFLPVDSYICVKNFLNFWEPTRVIFVESEIWPNLIFESRMMGAEVFLVNARMSKKSAAKWNYASKIGFRIFDCFSAIFVQSEDDQKRFSEISNSEVLFLGNLKSQVRDLSFNPAELENLQARIGNRKYWLAASTHKGEEEFVIQTHRELKKSFPDLLTILVPRHPNRADEIISLFGEINFAQRSKKQTISDTTEIYLADSLGELGTFYRLAKFAFVGGSLFEIGGHTPFEAIKLGCVVISGRGVFNNKEIYRQLENNHACVMIDNPAQLTVSVQKFLQDPALVQAMSEEALSLVESSSNIAENIVEKIAMFNSQS